jgi:hypothetical protein
VKLELLSRASSFSIVVPKESEAFPGCDRSFIQRFAAALRERNLFSLRRISLTSQNAQVQSTCLEISVVRRI